MDESLSVTFSYDNARGVYAGKVNGGQTFLFSGHRDAPLPKPLANALEALRHLTMLAERERNPKKDEHLTLDEVLEKIREYERKGGKISRTRADTKKAISKLVITDLEIEA